MASSEEWGWDWAYYFMCMGSLPPLFVLLFVRDNSNGGILGGAGEVVEEDDNVSGEGAGVPSASAAHEPLLLSGEVADENVNHETQINHRNFTLFSEMKACVSSPVLVTLSLGWAAIIGVVASLGTFGGAFVLALQLYDDEREAAYWFGISAALAGVIGTPIGGTLADKILERYVNNADGARRGEGIDDSLRHPIIASMLSRINILVAVSMIFIFSTLAMREAAFFLAFLVIGWTLLCE